MSFTNLKPATDAVRRIINPNSVSFARILQDLYTDLESRPEGQKWSSRFRGGVGTTLMEWLSAVTEDLKVASLISARESSLQTARSRINIIRLATDRGYVVNRQTAARLNLGVYAYSGAVLDPLVELGTIDNVSVFPLESTILNAGQIQTIPVIFGERRTSSVKQTTTTDAFNSLSWTAQELDLDSVDQIDNGSPAGDQTLEVWVDGVQRPITMFPEELAVTPGDLTLLVKNLGDRIEIVSGFDGIPAGVDVFLRYVKVSKAQATSDQVNLAAAMTGIISYDPTTAGQNEIITNFIEADSNKKIATLAPGFSFSNRRCVTKQDYEVIANSLPGIRSAKWHEGNCYNGGLCHGNLRTELTCSTAPGAGYTWVPAVPDIAGQAFGAPIAILGDNGPLSQAEKDNVLTAMDQYKFEGSHVVLFDPVELPLEVNLQIDLAEDIDAQTSTDLTDAIRVFAESLVGELGGSWKPAQLVQAVARMEGVLHVYINNSTSATTAATQSKNELVACTNQYFSIDTINVVYKRDDTVFLSHFGA